MAMRGLYYTLVNAHKTTGADMAAMPHNAAANVSMN